MQVDLYLAVFWMISYHPAQDAGLSKSKACSGVEPDEPAVLATKVDW